MGDRCSGTWTTDARVVEATGVTDIPTRVSHPQPNGVVERLHRTHQEEGLPEDILTDYYAALDTLATWGQYYNHVRPHSALQYLCPADYYRGDPTARLAERKEKVVRASVARQAYWYTDAVVKEPVTLTQITTSTVSIRHEQNTLLKSSAFLILFQSNYHFEMNQKFIETMAPMKSYIGRSISYFAHLVGLKFDFLTRAS